MHELSHALWEKLEGVRHDEYWIGVKRLIPADKDKFRLLREGYATYSQSIWFRDFYPSSFRNNLACYRLDHNSIYYQGLKRIKELVKQFGDQILLEIPKQWKNF